MRLRRGRGRAMQGAGNMRMQIGAARFHPGGSARRDPGTAPARRPPHPERWSFTCKCTRRRTLFGNVPESTHQKPNNCVPGAAGGPKRMRQIAPRRASRRERAAELLNRCSKITAKSDLLACRTHRKGKRCFSQVLPVWAKLDEVRQSVAGIGSSWPRVCRNRPTRMGKSPPAHASQTPGDRAWQ